MNSNRYFSQAPVAKEWRRSIFPVTPQETSNYTSFNLGDLVPLYKPIQVIPHDTFKLDLKSLIRMPSAIKSPFMDGLAFDAYAFFIPMRLVWDKTAQFFGENTTGAGVASEVTIPRWDIRFFQQMNHSGNTLIVSDYQKTLASHLGIPKVDLTDSSISSLSCDCVNILPFRAYWLCYNWYFRDQNLIAPVQVAIGGSGDVTTNAITNSISGQSNNAIINDNSYGTQALLAKASKKHDYFTSMLPYAEKVSTPVKIPIQGVAPLTIGATYNIKDADTSGQDGVILDSIKVLDGSSLPIGSTNGTVNTTAAIKSNVYADLASATATSLQLIRESLALFRLLEIDAIGGTRYDEQIFSHFGSRPPSLSFKPELLGEVHFSINVDQVVSHAGTSDESLGDVGAYSVTGNNSSMIMKSFTEPGYILILGVARQKTHIYTQGLDPLWSMSRRYDHYYPEFANFGLVPAYKREIMAGVKNTNVFGYKEYGSEHRYFTPMATGVLNPNVTGSLDFWTLADTLPSNVSLSQTFIEEDDSNLKRALITPTQDQFVARFGLEGQMVRVVPIHSLPKMII